MIGGIKMPTNNADKSTNNGEIVLKHSLMPPHSNGGKGGNNGGNSNNTGKNNNGGVKK